MELSVNISSKNICYDIDINNSSLDELAQQILSIIAEKNYIVVINKKVYKLYSKILTFPKSKIFLLPDGENQKNMKNYTKILDFALRSKLTRCDYIVAIGGGVAGDITGFVAATYMRGINLIQVPTTLLSATDSSVGGKVAINTKYGKNLVGSFYQPCKVIINVNFLKTLDDVQYKSGLGEVLKYSFIEKNCRADETPTLMNFLSDNQDKILNKDSLTLIELIKKCLELKIAVVQQDEKEAGLRKVLNYGHTYGHAVETITNYNKYTHGQCVVEGIKVALSLAFSKKLIQKDYKFICDDLIEKYNYPSLKKFDLKKIIKIMQSDKKATSDKIRLIIPCDYAKVTEVEYTPDELFDILDNL